MSVLIIALIIIIIILMITKMINNFAFGKRCDGNPKLKYFVADDFEGLTAKPIEFKSDKVQILRGNIYTHEDIKEYKGLIVFVHGMGGGHLSYTTELNTFAKAGFKVFAYDNTGTFSSEGKALKGFFQAVIDLKNALKYISENEELNKYKIALVGHSWGAYTVCQILRFKPNVKAVVAISAPNDSSRVICDIMKSQFLKPFFWIINFLTFGSDGVKTTVSVLKDADTPILILHGDSDETVPLSNSLISNELDDKKNIKKILYKERLHNVYQTKESEKYLSDTFAEIRKRKDKQIQEKIYNEIDFKKMTEEDESVMKTIIDFIETNI